MSVLDNMLENIISNSGIYFYKEEIENEFTIDDIIVDLSEAIRKMWNDLPCEANIAIYGLGRDSRYLFESVDLTKKNVVCMIDNNSKTNIFNGYPVIRSKDIPNYNIDIVIITSRAYSYEMRLSVEEAAPNCKAIYMWEEFHTTGYIFHRELGEWHSKELIYRMLLLNKITLLYKAEHDFRYLFYVLGTYLEFKDLRNALIIIDKCLASDCPDMNKLFDLKGKLLDLLNIIKQKLKAKRNRHTLVLIADSMSAKDVTPELTPFLYDLGQNNIYCPNAHSHTGWTTTSILTTFKQKSYIDNHLYRNVTLTGTEPIFEYTTKNNIDFLYISHAFKNLFVNIPELIKLCQKGAADLIWNYLCLAFEEDQKGLYFLHFIETHVPLICFYHANRIDFFRSHIDKSDCVSCVKYIDSQTEFLFELLPDTTSLLFCSDHSCCRGIPTIDAMLFGYDNGGHHIPYIICDRKTHTGTNKRVISHLDTSDILLNLMSDKSAFDNISDRVLAEFNQEFLCGESTIKKAVDIKPHRACKCFISDKDMYIIFYDGEELYYLLTDDFNNLIDDPEYTGRINWFRQNINTEFPDWSDDNGRYDISRKYYYIGSNKGS